ncbi:hypothetical protein V1506DRAFT_531498 [Lipomyces tetrasporus]
MDRKAPRHSRLSHSETPYSRPLRPSTMVNGDAPQTPLRGHEGLPAQTPGSIFSKVISMFTPSRWNSPRHQQRIDVSDAHNAIPERNATGISNNGGPVEQGSEPEQADNTPTRYLPFLFSPAKANPPITPTQSLEPLAFTAVQVPPSEAQTTSPNQMLASFFREKGDAPLSSIEMQGVVALMRQAQQQQLQEQRQSGPSQSSFSRQISPPSSVTEQLYPSVPSFATPGRRRSATPSLRAPRYNPILTPQPRRTVTPAVTKPKSAVQYPTISTPFKSRTTTPQPGSEKRLKTGSDVSLAVKAEPKQVQSAALPATQQDASTTPSAGPQRLSHTASALLSLIVPVGTPAEIAKARVEDRNRLTDPSIKPFVNPYAAPTPLAGTPTRRKQVRKESLLGAGSARKKRRALDEIERTIPVEEKIGAFASGVASATPVRPSSNATSSQPVPKVSTPSPRPAADIQITKSNGSSMSKPSPPAVSSIEKFKPTKSSNLRESIVMNSPESPVESHKEQSALSTSNLASETRVVSGISLSFDRADTFTPAVERETKNRPSRASLTMPASTLSFSVPTPTNSQNFSKPEAKDIPSDFDKGAQNASRIATPIAATIVSAKRGESEEKALSTSDYRAYVPRFFFSDPASVEVSGGSEDVKQKARDAPEKAFQDYKFRFTFPEISRAASCES